MKRFVCPPVVGLLVAGALAISSSVSVDALRSLGGTAGALTGTSSLRTSVLAGTASTRPLRSNIMTWLTNLFFPTESPAAFREYFTHQGCPTWLLDPNRPAFIQEDFLPSSGWVYDESSQSVDYTEFDEMKEPAHIFPFFFLPRRFSARTALIKRNFLCPNTRVQAEIQLGSAEAAGLLFRGIGERSFWAVLLPAGGNIQLIRVNKGDKWVLESIPDITVARKVYHASNLNLQ